MSRFLRLKFKILPMMLLWAASCFSQQYPPGLSLDSNQAFLQFYHPETGSRFRQLFDSAGSDKVVIFHFGASHIQAERPTTFTREELQKVFGDGGRGMMFNYAAANTYSSVNYVTKSSGKWSWTKSYQGKTKIPAGVCGMTVESRSENATLDFRFRKVLPPDTHQLIVFIENHSAAMGFDLMIDSSSYSFGRHVLDTIHDNAVRLIHTGSIGNIRLKTHAPVREGAFFRFYGIDIERIPNSGLVYHSLGVGAAAMRSMLSLVKMPEQAAILKPDVAILDFGTNDILYTNSISPDLPGQIREIIATCRAVNPEMLIILTSVQDLYRKGKFITAGPLFRDMADSIARAEKCMFWNWHDAAGGLGTIRKWYELGFAQSDYIHLSQEGYRIKGTFLARSFLNTYRLLCQNPGLQKLSIPAKNYQQEAADSFTVPEKVAAEEIMTGGAIEEFPVSAERKRDRPNKKAGRAQGEKAEWKKASGISLYKVPPGMTLSELAEIYHTSVAGIKKANGLYSDFIRAGQTLKIPATKSSRKNHR